MTIKEFDKMMKLTFKDKVISITSDKTKKIKTK